MFLALRSAEDSDARKLAAAGEWWPASPLHARQAESAIESACAEKIPVHRGPLENLDLDGGPGNDFVIIIKYGNIFQNTTDCFKTGAGAVTQGGRAQLASGAFLQDLVSRSGANCQAFDNQEGKHHEKSL